MSNASSHKPTDEIDARKLIELNPHSAQAYYHLAQLLADDPARIGDAETAYRRAVDLEPNTARYIYRLGLFLHENTQRFPEAETAYRRAIDLAPADPFVYGGLLNLLMRQSRHTEALTLSATMRTLLLITENWYGLTTLDSILGNIDTAFDHLRKAASAVDFNRAWARIDPDLAALRDDPRFDEIVGG